MALSTKSRDGLPSFVTHSSRIALGGFCCQGYLVVGCQGNRMKQNRGHLPDQCISHSQILNTLSNDQGNLRLAH
jgi:hypothetical protein